MKKNEILLDENQVLIKITFAVKPNSCAVYPMSYYIAQIKVNTHHIYTSIHKYFQ